MDWTRQDHERHEARMRAHASSSTRGPVAAPDNVSSMRLALSETDLHVHCIAWCYSHPDERLHHVYAVPNESPRSKRYGAELKRKGMTSGVSDIVIPIPSGPYGHLYVELKHGTNDITDAQAAFLRSMQACGNAVIVCDTLDQFQTFVREYLHEPWHFVGGI